MDSFIIEFSKQQLEVLNSVLIEMPFKMASPLIEHINAQIRLQVENTKSDG